MKTYNLTVHYQNDPDDDRGYEDEIEANSLEEAISKVREIEDFRIFNYYVIECGEEYYNSSEEPGFIDRS